MKILPTYEPAIHTIPDDSIVFSLVQKDTPQYNKLIMENYINFIAYINSADQEILIRFNDYLNWTNFKGFECMFIPREIYQTAETPINTIINMIDNEYYIMCFVDKFYISFYSKQYQEFHSSHTVMINGYNEEKKCFYCKDYKNFTFLEYEMTFEEFENSLVNYDFFSNDTLGLYGLKVKKDISFEVDYARCYSEFIELKHGRDGGNIAYGMSALEKSLLGLRQSEEEERTNLDTWIESANYVRESVSLMLDRSKFLSSQFHELDTRLMMESVQKLKGNTDLFFTKVMKIVLSKGEITKHLKSFYELFTMILNEYKILIDENINVLDQVLTYQKYQQLP